MVIYSGAAAAGAQAALERVCPGCHKKQVVSPKDVKASVKCDKCGAIIPPKRGK